jgi:hypothetical protein
MNQPITSKPFAASKQLVTNKTHSVPGVGSPEQDRRIVTLEQRVAELEAALQRLTSVLIVNSSSSEVVLKARTIKVEAQVDFELRAGSNATFNSGANLTLKSSASARLESGASTEVRSGGMTKVNGSKPVARQTDNVAGVSGSTLIVAGNPTVLA